MLHNNISVESIIQILDRPNKWKGQGFNSNSGYDLTDLDLRKVPFSGRDLRGAKFQRSNLSDVDFTDCNLQFARFHYANLTNAYMFGADCQHTYFFGAKLTGINLIGANITHAQLERATVRDVIWNYSTQGFAPAPEGELIGWGHKSACIIKMLIPREAKRSWATSRKLRAEYVKVLSIERPVMEMLETLEHPNWIGEGTTLYTVGQTTYPNGWDKNRWIECSNGIHFFLTRHEAETW